MYVEIRTLNPPNLKMQCVDVYVLTYQNCYKLSSLQLLCQCKPKQETSQYGVNTGQKDKQLRVPLYSLLGLLTHGAWSPTIPKNPALQSHFPLVSERSQKRKRKTEESGEGEKQEGWEGVLCEGQKGKEEQRDREQCRGERDPSQTGGPCLTCQ